MNKNILMYGADISVFQGNINFSLLSKKIKFIIIRAGYGNSITQKDAKFDYNVQQALNYGLHIGSYWFSYAISPADSIKEAQLFKKILKPFYGKMDMPVAFDFEGDSVRYFTRINHRSPTSNDLIAIRDAFIHEMNKGGWYCVNYTNKNYIRTYSNWNNLGSEKTWLADYYKYTAGNPVYDCGIQQYSDIGSIDGINGHKVDLDAIYINYPDIIKNSNLNGLNSNNKPIDDSTNIVSPINNDEECPFKLGTLVKIRKGSFYAKTPKVTAVPDWVCNNSYSIKQIDEKTDTVLLDKIMSWVKFKNIYSENTTYNNPVTTPSTDIKVGSLVQVKKGSHYSKTSNAAVPDWVCNNKYPILQISGEDILLSGIMSWVNKNSLVGLTNSFPKVTTPSADIKVGSLVQVKKGSHYSKTSNAAVPDWVCNNTYKVIQVDNSGNVLLDNIMSWVNKNSLVGSTKQPVITKTIKVGIKVKVKKDSHYSKTSAAAVPDWVCNNIYKVIQVDGKNALLDGIMSWVSYSNLIII